MVCCGIVGRGACIQSLLFSVLLVLVFPFLSSREFSGPTSHMYVLESQCVKTMGYIMAIAQARMFTLESQTDPSDVAEIMLALLDEERSRVVLQPITKGDGCSGDSAEDSLAVHGKSESQQTVAQQSEVTSETSTSCPVLERDLPQVQSRPKQSSEDCSAEASVEDANSQQKVAANPFKPSSLKPEKDLSTGDDQTEQSTSERSMDDTQYSSSKSHNKLRKCSLCGYFGTHLARHIASKHKEKGPAEVSQLVAKADQRLKGASQAQVNPNSQRYQCGYKNCTAIVTRKSQHLVRYHKLTDRNEIKKAQNQFTKLTSTGKRKSRELGASAPKKKKVKWVKPKVSDKQPATPKPSKVSDEQPATPKPSKIKKIVEIEDSGSDETEESFKSNRHSDEDSGEDDLVDEGYLNIEAQLDEMSSFAESDNDDWQESEKEEKWSEFYLSDDKGMNVRQHFMSTFYKYLIHIEGGGHSEEQALLHTRQVHIILETLEENGSDLKCLVKNNCMNIWDVFAGPRLKNKVLTGNTIKTFLRSLEIFAKFIEKGLFYKKDLLPDLQRESLRFRKDCQTTGQQFIGGQEIKPQQGRLMKHSLN